MGRLVVPVGPLGRFGGPSPRARADAFGELFGRVAVGGCVSTSGKQYTGSPAPSTATTPSFTNSPRPAALAPGRLFFLMVLSLMELLGLPKVKQLSASRRVDGDSLEQVR